MKGRSEASLALAPEKLRPWHETIAEMWIAEPTLTQGEIAARLGKSQGWLSVIVNCDAFQEYLHNKKDQIIDPVLKAGVEERMRVVANKAADVFLEKLHLAPGSFSNRDLIAAMKIAGVEAQGLGNKTPQIQNNLYVLPSPHRPTSSTEWAQIVEAEIGTPQS